MSGKRNTLIVVAALAIVALAMSGCTKPATPQSSSTTKVPTAGSEVATPQASVEPTVTIPLNTSGPITTPASGTTLRKELLDATRAKLGSTTQYYVHQLFVQGDTALGDLEPVTKDANGRVFVAWERRSGGWVAIGASKFGSAAANAASTARALPSFSPELIAKINWTLKKAAETTAPKSPSESSVKASLSTAAKAWSKTAMSGTGSPYAITLIKVAKDSKGMWWGRAVTQPTGGYERLQFWAKYENGDWSGAVQDPEPPAPSTYFPTSVTSKLGF